MPPVLTAAQMREVDRLTSEKYGIPSIVLMENAASAVARVISEKLGGSVKDKQILILCGPGNNGGDGAALARILWTQGARVEALVWGDPRNSKGDAKVNFDALASLTDNVELVSVDSPERLSQYWDDIHSVRKVDAIVDAVFGTGLNRPVEEPYLSFLELAQNYASAVPAVPVFAVDIPSGLNSDGGEPHECPLKADFTVTFTAAKPALVLSPTYRACGEVFTANIGSAPAIVNSIEPRLFVAEKADASAWLKLTGFSSDSYKNKRGHTLVIAGSESYSGAAVLAGNAAMRSGVGLVTVVTPGSSKDSIAARLLPEVMVRGVDETENAAIAEPAFDEIADLLEKADSIAIGCGLSQSGSTQKFVERIVEERQQPVVIDADALNLLAPFSMHQRPDQAVNFPLILTPHEGEFLRLLGTEAKDAIWDRVAVVREFATTHNIILVLKGERVLIGAPDGRVVVNPTGNSGLGKAGNGDTLTGILAGFTAQAAKMNIDIFETVVAAVYAAGMAGDIAEKKYGNRVMTASDVRECLVEVFANL
ncbi:MAG: NAD(P)H-hydrate dehydratase [Pyrinomonadaceae bacterium]